MMPFVQAYLTKGKKKPTILASAVKKKPAKKKAKK
jgi:hypothetical protein